MNLLKQDRNGVRTPTDIERRYKLGAIGTTENRVTMLERKSVLDTELSSTSTNAVQNKVITEELNTKVNKINGKQLSTNDFTDEDKEAIHTHDNKEILDSIENIEVIHTHSNKEILDSITEQDIDTWNNSAINNTETILYEATAGTKEDFTLTEGSVNNFKKIKIYGEDDIGIKTSVEVENNNENFRTVLQTSRYPADVTGTIQNKTADISITGTQVTFNSNGYYNIVGSGNSYVSGAIGSSGYIKILKIVGYND